MNVQTCATAGYSELHKQLKLVGTIGFMQQSVHTEDHQRCSWTQWQTVICESGHKSYLIICKAMTLNE